MTTFTLIGGAAIAAGLVVFGGVFAWTRRSAGAAGAQVPVYDVPREQWTMPPIALLERPRQSAGRRAAMLALEAYLVLAIVLLVVKAVQLAGG